MKSLQHVVRTAAVALGLCACGGSTQEAESADDASEGPAEGDDLSDDEFWAQEAEKAPKDTADDDDDDEGSSGDEAPVGN